MKTLLPKRLGRYLKSLLGIQYLHDQNAQIERKLEQLETNLYESRDGLEAVAKGRWRISKPDKGLTWGKVLTGNNFIRSAKVHGLFDAKKSILEIGPGYGRLVIAMEEEGIDFTEYLGIDISESQIQFLNEKFSNNKRRFVHADAETFAIDRTYDLLISSLTFKHMFPSFKKAMQNISKYMNQGSFGFIDFIEGERRFFEKDGVTFIRHYSKEELVDVFSEADFEVVDFDYVVHDEGFTRIVAIIRKVC